MLEFMGLVALLAALAADDRQQPLPVQLKPHPSWLLSQRLKADEVWGPGGGRVSRSGPPPDGFMYFASGSSRPAHIRGFATIGHPIGVVAGELSPAGMDELVKLAHMQLDIFVDSGAFNEVRSGVEPDWAQVIGVYDTLSRAVGEWVHVVAPDKIGDQQETLRRMQQYGPAFIKMARRGAEVFVPLQGGAMSLAEFEEQALRALGVTPDLLHKFVPALPLKAAVLPIEDVLNYVGRQKPRRLHLLGLGPKRRRSKGRPSGEELISMIRERSPYTELSLDSAVIPATSGLTGGPGGGARILGGARELLRQGGADPTAVQEYSIPVAWPEQHAEAAKRWGPRGRHIHEVPESISEAQREYAEIWAERTRGEPGEEYGVAGGTKGGPMAGKAKAWAVKLGAATNYFQDPAAQAAALEYWWASKKFKEDPSFRAAVSHLELGPADTTEAVRRVTGVTARPGQPEVQQQIFDQQVQQAIREAEYFRSGAARAAMQQALAQGRTTQDRLDWFFERQLKSEFPYTPDWAAYASIGKHARPGRRLASAS